MRVYIAGPMQGYAEHNFPAFNNAAGYLRTAGYDVVNPVDINPDGNTPWVTCMQRDIKALVDCDTVGVLPGWECSRGASLEVHIAKALGLRVVPWHLLLEVAA